MKYFNYNGCTAFLPAKNIFPFKDLDDFWEQIKALNIKKSKIKSFALAVYKAIEEANFFKQYPVSERVKMFDDILRHQKSNKSTTQKLMESSEIENERSSITAHKNERRSIDSALEYPTFDPNKKDPIVLYLSTMKSYDAKHTPNVTKKKQPNLSKKECKVEFKQTTLEDDAKRRKSIRAVRKRKFEDFAVDLRVEPGSELQGTASPSSEPKAKRIKVVKEETLEERFSIDAKDLRTIFRNVTKKRACVECLEISKEPTYRCNGSALDKCSGWFHQKCSGKFENVREEIRHQCGDSDEIIQTQATKTILTCKRCTENVKNCAACYQPVEFGEEFETQHCPNTECRLAYHKKCLNFWPQNQIGKGNNKLCPAHTCHTCFCKDIHNSGPLVKCIKCPSAYHLQVTCVPAGYVVRLRFIKIK